MSEGSSGVPATERSSDRTLSVTLDAFAWEAFRLECGRLGVPEQELAAFAIAYYLADLDSGRIARSIPAARGG